MTPENTKKLYDKYPKLFFQKDLSMKETCMCWGFECGDGWYHLIDNLCEAIQSYIEANNKQQTEVTQVKEKYGTLSFYTWNTDELINGMVWLAEHMSGNICEICGSTKEITQTKGWIRTLCKDCANHADKFI